MCRTAALFYKLAGGGELRPVGIRAACEREKLLVIGLRGSLVAELFGGLGGAQEAPVAVRLLRLGCLEGRERLLCHAAIEQHLAVELARRRERSGCDRMLLGLVLGV